MLIIIIWDHFLCAQTKWGENSSLRPQSPCDHLLCLRCTDFPLLGSLNKIRNGKFLHLAKTRGGQAVSEGPIGIFGDQKCWNNVSFSLSYPPNLGHWRSKQWVKTVKRAQISEGGGGSEKCRQKAQIYRFCFFEASPNLLSNPRPS